MAADFTFDVDAAPDADALHPLYAAILGPAKENPTLSLGAVTRLAAETWLASQHARYVQGVGSRSGLLKKMRLQDRVELVDLVPA